MTGWVRWTLAAALILGALPTGFLHGRASAQDVILSRSYVRGRGEPVLIADTFTVCDPGGQFTLVVENGPGGEPRVSSGTIRLNGVPVVDQADLNQQAARLERPLRGVQTSNTLEVHLGSQPGGTLMVSVRGVQVCGLRITSPAPGAVLPGPKVVVRGLLPLTGSASGDAAVTVNGVPALLERNGFAALVSVDPTVTALTAEATDLAGTVLDRTSIPVTVQPGSPTTLDLTAVPAAGGAPLTVSLALTATVPIAHLTLDLEGDGTVDFQGPSLEGQRFTYGQPGVFAPSVQVTDRDGRVHRAATLVHVADPVALDARLQAVWQSLKDALRAGDLAAAAQFLHSGVRARYLALFARLSPAALAAIDQYMTAIRLEEVGFGGAKYEMLRPQEDVTLSFAVWFQLDVDGHWRLRRF